MSPSKPLKLSVTSEIETLEAVMLHRPGPEVENMEPENAEKALYSDILNLSVAQKEYAELFMVLSKTARTFEVETMLKEVLAEGDDRDATLMELLDGECTHHFNPSQLKDLKADDLARALIEGVLIERDSLTRFLSGDTYSVKPLHNFLFVRDTAMVIGNRVLLSKPAGRVRRRESRIMRTIFTRHPMFGQSPLDASSASDNADEISIEGGDVLVARKDLLVVGIGNRTTAEGVDFIVSKFSGTTGDIRHILVQELPQTLESFIHLDMVFTLLDRDSCMVFAPLVLHEHRFKPIHITVNNGKVKVVREDENLVGCLKKLGLDLKPILCGGADERHQRREQWHSGANFFAAAPGKVLGYARNEYTLDALNKEGFEIISAGDIISGRTDLRAQQKCVIAVKGSELARGGGGCRCLTLPLRRKAL